MTKTNQSVKEIEKSIRELEEQKIKQVLQIKQMEEERILKEKQESAIAAQNQEDQRYINKLEYIKKQYLNFEDISNETLLNLIALLFSLIEKSIDEREIIFTVTALKHRGLK